MESNRRVFTGCFLMLLQFKFFFWNIIFCSRLNDNLSSQNEKDLTDTIDERPRAPNLKVTGSAFAAKPSNQYLMTQGRPLPTAQSIQDPLIEEEAFRKYTEAKKLVHIPTIFKGTTVRNYVKEFGLGERVKREEAQLAAIKIQRNYRRHLRDKRFIESRKPITPEMLEWAKNYKKQIKRRKSAKSVLIADEEARLEFENKKFQNLISRIGIHVDLYM
jgi:hypothetical protein